MTTSHGLPRAQWRTSTRSGANGNCVEIAHLDVKIGVRDSKASDSGHLTLTVPAWAAFIAEAKAGHYDVWSRTTGD